MIPIIKKVNSNAVHSIFVNGAMMKTALQIIPDKSNLKCNFCAIIRIFTKICGFYQKTDCFDLPIHEIE